MDAARVTAIVLAGGTGRRVGLRNKGLISFEGRPLIAHVLNRIQPQVEHTIIVANADLTQYRELCTDVIEDNAFHGEGPLAGILAGAKHAQSEWLLVAPCDLPYLPTDLVERFAHALSEKSVAIAHDGDRPQFLVALMHRDIALRIEDYLNSSRRSVYGWLATLEFATVDFSDQPHSFRNINTPEDLR